jgi:hypothetical protein
MMCESDKTRRRVPLIERNTGGRFTPSQNSLEVTVDLPVQYIVYDRNCKRIGQDPQTIHGKINLVVGYKGTVDYLSEKRGHFPGGMGLLKEIPGRH